jgi:molecular chaperone GrpE
MTRIPIDDGNEITEETDQEQPAREAAAPPGGGGSGGPSGSGPDDPQRLREERDTYYDRWVRSKADAENMRKRMQGEFDQRCQYANQSLIKSLLPVIDNFERALAQDASKVDAAAILKGMQIVHDQWLSVLRQQNVEEIAPTPGTPFDPTRHEALMQQDAPQYKSPTVTQLLQKGYALQGRTLRPAQVAVSRTS